MRRPSVIVATLLVASRSSAGAESTAETAASNAVPAGASSSSSSSSSLATETDRGGEGEPRARSLRHRRSPKWTSKTNAADASDPPPRGGLRSLQRRSFTCTPPQKMGLCTATDPDAKDECSDVGEPCPDGIGGEHCCLDLCGRKYCTAKGRWNGPRPVPAMMDQNDDDDYAEAEENVVVMDLDWMTRTASPTGRPTGTRNGGGGRPLEIGVGVMMDVRIPPSNDMGDDDDVSLFPVLTDDSITITWRQRHRRFRPAAAEDGDV